ncbi:non-ribosomal peptide synthetase, partial [Amycolatopsis sp.]|uniref:non-ribosomal peptide synthetase n=1 Tax=Amycolatopsis sp. TaxID=37632 RepID=UPI002E029664
EERSAVLRRKYGISELANFDATHYPLTLVVTPGERMRVTLSYRDDVIEDSAAEALLTRFTALVETLIGDFSATVGALGTTSPAERTELVRDWDSTVHPVPNDTVADLLAGQAARTPDAIALVFGEQSVTYAELDDRINRMARLLLSRGAAPERIVALGLPRSIDMVVALFAVLRTGAAYLPLELDYPVERLAMMLDDARPLVLVSTSEVAARIPDETPRALIDTDEVVAELESLSGAEIHDDERPSFARGNADRMEHPAYVIYTSGSTGKPKGVVTPYRGLTNMQLNHQEAIFAPAIDSAGGRRLRIAHTVSFAFDMSWEELLWLIEGHEVHVCDEELRRDAEALVAYCNAHEIDVINVTPTYAHLLIEEGLLEGHRPALVLLGGEAVSESVWNRLRDTEGTYGYNLYGPTEYTINTLGGGTTDSDTPTVGKPIWNTRAYILDAWLRPVPDGVPGELYISGTGLARGYLDRRSLTSERFVADPFGEPGGRMYRTGDLVRRRADGNLDFLGRTDDQVKIRGYRVELGEIESVLVRHPHVAQAAVIARPDPSAPGTQRLIGYVVPAELTGEARDQVEAEQVGEWEQIYSDEYTEIPTAMFQEDFAGWDSSYDGDPIPLPHMREWRAATVARITELNPKRMLEIGVGTGLLLSQLAPIAEEYWGTDLAAPVIGKLKADLSRDPELAAKVNLRAQAAHVSDGLPRGHFDTIVINSVIQYFPSIDYLTDVITTALELLAPGGALFVGDIRNLRLVRSFHTAIQLTRSDESSDPGHLRRAIERGVALEKELLIDPDYFAALQRTIPGIGVEVKTKRARLHNELSRYRYDAVIYREPTDIVPLAQAPRLPWGGDLDEVRAQLSGDSLRVTRIPDARIGAEFEAMRLLDSGGTLVDVLARFRSAGDGVEPEALHDLGADLGYQVHTTWSSTVDGTFDAVFVRDQGRTAALYVPASASTNLAHFANNPTAARGSSALVQRLREELKEQLPDYMIPAAFVTLGSLPLTDNGKLNVKALPDADPAVSLAESRDAESPQEETLCALFAEVLGLERVGVEDNFFDLGGHSLLATRLISRARTELGAELAIRDLFEAPTPAELAERATGGEPARPAVTAVERPERLPLSAAQQRLLLLEELGEVGEAYNFPLVFRLRGELDVDALRASFGDVVARHESLRTVFGDHEGEPFQLILDAVEPAFEIGDCEESEVDERVAALANRAFDLRAEIPLRVDVLRIGEQDHVVALVLHHITTDEWSDRPFFADLATAYRARVANAAPEWAPLAVQYADYTLWQRSLLDRLAPAQLAFWTETLGGLPEELTLPLDRPRPVSPTGRGAKVRVELPAPIAHGLRGLSTSSGTSLFMLLHTAVATLLHRMGAGDDIPLGAPVAGRGDDALNDLVGFFVNTLVLRSDVSGEPTFAELLARFRETDLAAFGNQDLPFERVVEALNPARIAGRNPLFQVMVGYHFRPGGDPDVLGLPTEWRELPPESAKFDLHFTVVDETADGSVTLLLEYAEDLAERGTATRLLDRLVSVLGLAVANPARPIAEFDVLTGDELELVGTKWNDTGREITATTLPDQFEAQVARTPDAVALVFENTELTYGELNARANRLSRWLVEQGAGPESVVAVALPRSLELVVALYAVHKAGAAYLPLDTGYPADRLAFMLEDAAPVCVLDDLGLFDRLDGYDDSNPVRELSPENPAYVIYTSGSTGKPKGVVVPHSGIVNRLLWTQDEYRLESTDRVLQKTPSSFDVSVWEFFWPLITGATLVVAKPDGHREPRYLAELIQEQRITTVHFVPSMLRLFLEEPESARCTGLRRVLCSGEALPEDLAARFRATLDAGLHNLYGPTEASVDVTSWAVVDGPVAIGRPVWNTQVHVLDARLRPVAPGVAGELYLAGVQLARGYLGRAGLTAERFVANPFGEGSRLYRTGDLARWRADGTVEYLGRVDEQVKLRGFRIELGEIETVLSGHSSVAHVRVIAREDRLVAYVVPTGSFAADDVRGLAEAALPEFMVPSAFVEVREIPLTPNGKLDRKALPAPEFTAGSGRQPNTPRETALCELFATVLGVDRVGVDDDFFALGGHSLLVMRLAGRIRSTFGVEVSLRAVFDAPTVAKLAAVLSDAEESRPALVPAGRPEILPLSAAQQSLRFLYSLEGASSTYNIPIAWRLTGQLDLDALRAAVHDVVGRHETLRTVFPDRDGVMSQRILAPERANVEVLAVRPDEIAATADYCFELDREPPLRVTFAEVAPGEHLVVFLFHHIASDEWSELPFFADFANAYTALVAGADPQWTPLPVQYADFALWQRTLLGTPRDPGAVAKRQLDFWRETLADLPEEIALPVDRPRPQEASYRGGQVLCTLDTSLETGLRELARVHDVSMFMLVQAGVATLLHRLGAGTDIPLGAPISGRTEESLEDLVGYFLNSLVLRTDLSGNPAFTELLGRVRETDLAAFSNQDVPFDRLVEALNPARSLARHPLFQVMVVYLAAAAEDGLSLPGLSAEREPVEVGTSKFDLSFDFVEEQGGGITVSLEYSSDLFDRSTVERFGERLLRVLEQVVADPSQPVGSLDVLDPDERELIVRGWNDTALAVEPSTVPGLFEAQAAKTPDAIAVVSGEVEWTFAELNDGANRLARLLVAEGVGPEDLVALMLPRSADVMLSILAVHKAGAAYLPLDPDYPAERVTAMLDDARPSLVLTVRSLAETLPETRLVVLDECGYGRHEGENLTDADRLRPLSPQNPAYVIYTSGSTGRPKGVVVAHRSVVNLFHSHRETLYRPAVASTGRDQLRVGHAWSFAFDASWQPQLWLLDGHAVHVVPEEIRRDPELLAAEVRRAGFDFIEVTPSYFAQMADVGLIDGDSCPLAVVGVGGEAVPTTLWERLGSLKGTEAFNLYGPTESTVDALVARIGDSARPLVGRPVANTRAYVLDGGLNPVPAGVRGELYLAGRGLARGYLGQAALTAERFVADPFDIGGRMYRTGDLAKWTADGRLDFGGRADHQVKIRGFRIEPAEIEAALERHSAVSQALVVVRDGRQLVAYVVTNGVGSAELRDHVGGLLPEYMVPAAFVSLVEFPVLSNGKLDRKALPDPDFTELSTGREPRTDLEKTLSAVFSEVLDLPVLGIDDDFFALGGDSVVAMQLVGRARAAGLRISPRQVFQHRTVAGLGEVAAQISTEVVADAGTGTVALTPVMHAMRELGGPISGYQQAGLFLTPASLDLPKLIT